MLMCRDHAEPTRSRACTHGGLCMSEKCIFVVLSLMDLGVVLFLLQPCLTLTDKAGLPCPPKAPWNAHLEKGQS